MGGDPQRSLFCRAVFMPSTLVASIYGMKFKSMPRLNGGTAIFIALVLMVIVGVLPYLFFKWKKWLKSPPRNRTCDRSHSR